MPKAAAAAEPGIEGPCILLVSDDAPKAYVIEQMLADGGAHVTSARREEAAAEARVLAPDLVAVLDREDGLSVIDALATHATTAALPVAWVGGTLGPGTPSTVRALPADLVAPALVLALLELAPVAADRTALAPRAVDGSAATRLSHALDGVQRGWLVLQGREGVRSSWFAAPACSAGLLWGLDEVILRLEGAGGAEVALSFLVTDPGRARSIEEPTSIDSDHAPAIEDQRIVLLGPRRLFSTELGVALEKAGARVAHVDAGGAGLGRARALCPDLIVGDADTLSDTSSAAMRAVATDVRLAWAARLVVPSSDARPFASPLTADSIARSATAALALDHALRERARAGETFFARLEPMGPSRLLRALTEARVDLEVDVRHRTAHVELSIANGVIAGARAKGMAGELAEGHVAIATLLALPSGRVRIAPRTHLQLLDVMRPLDEVLGVALEQRAIGSLRPPPRAAEDIVPAPISSSALKRLLADRRAALEASTDAARSATTEPPRAPAPEREAASPPSAPADADLRATTQAARDERPAPAPRDTPPGPSDAAAPPPPPAVPSVAPEPPPPAAERARASRRVLAVAAVISVVAVPALALGPSIFGGDRPGVERDDAALEASFAAVEREADEDAVRESAAEDERARRARVAAPPSDAADHAHEPLPAPVLDGIAIDAMLVRAQMAWRRGDLGTAQRYYDDILHADPAHARALVGSVRIARRRGDLAEATRLARVLAETHADHPANRILLGDLLVATGDREGADAIFLETSREFPNNAPARERVEAMRHRR